MLKEGEIIMNKIAMITGATSGFGKETALRFAKEGYTVIITGRRKDRLDELAKEITALYGMMVLPLCFDVRNRDEVRKALCDIPAEWKAIGVLVNNAGLASGLDEIQTGDFEDWDKMIDTNVKGLLYVSEVIIPYMIDRKKGHIINIGSTAGKEVYPKGNVYCASKFAVDALTKGMRMDLVTHGIKVTQISPGAAETEFSEVRFHGDKNRASKIYEGYKPLAPTDIAEIIFYCASLPEHVCINDLVVTPAAQANSYVFHKVNNP